MTIRASYDQHRRTLLVEDDAAPDVTYMQERPDTSGVWYAEPSATHHPAWMLFSCVRGTAVVGASPNVRWTHVITGVRVVSSRWLEQVWTIARGNEWTSQALQIHAPRDIRLNGDVAKYLAMRERVERFGGLGGETARLPGIYGGLSPADRATVDARLRGESMDGDLPWAVRSDHLP